MKKNFIISIFVSLVLANIKFAYCLFNKRAQSWSMETLSIENMNIYEGD